MESIPVKTVDELEVVEITYELQDCGVNHVIC
ncbi:hypothetical protein Sked_07070 [Sanguibacter keddieii DSM 10542]|jgi:hypothetical protein|uniref:Uncharacterized protein n=1 Tax=Sanguibacter keddieii (strain ATCC 51767 / DSM 10542 / NCFB 3025 / ST-74) TaxID=446469 RepID=D1BB97_SANKS|nr:hypothetical protein Sked_07070 [Sanguibacter keddieii DSM 10542]